MTKVLVTGGAGYVGSLLVRELVQRHYCVTVLDLMIYGADVLPQHDNLVAVKGDIRDQSLLKSLLPTHDAVIHLACISNDPSFELNPRLGKSINLDAFEPLLRISIDSGVKRFVFASSSSVYGIKTEPDVTEDMNLEPLTDYSRYKAMCEDILRRYSSEPFTTVAIRPATVCGYSPRMRLDLTVNLLTNLAVNKGEITVFGGPQKRPNIHIRDMVSLYCFLLELPPESINGKTYNAGYENHTVAEIAEIVKAGIGNYVKITTVPTSDLRSYHISSQKIKRELGFAASHTIGEAVSDVVTAFRSGLIPDALKDEKYYNVKQMKKLDFQ